MFKEWLRQKRRAAGLTQGELAKKAGWHRDTILRLEKSDQMPTGDVVKQVGRALGIEDAADDYNEWSALERRREAEARYIPVSGGESRIGEVVDRLDRLESELTELRKSSRAQLDALAKIQRELRGLLPARERQRKTEEPLGTG